MVADCARSRILPDSYRILIKHLIRKRRTRIAIRSSAPARPAQVNLEIHQRVILLERPHIRDVEMRSVEQIELSLEIEVKKSFDGMMRRNDAAADGSLGCSLLHFRPVFVAARFWAGGYRNGRSARCRRIFFP